MFLSFSGLTLTHFSFGGHSNSMGPFPGCLKVQALHNSLARGAREKKWNLQIWAEADDETDRSNTI